MIEKLVPELTKRGYAVATIKHDAHQFDIDHQGKDSWRHKQAGAVTTVISSPAKAAVVKSVDRELTLDEIAVSFLMDVDIILTEGFKREAKPKIEVVAPGDIELISPLSEIIMIAADTTAEFGRPTVKRDDIAAIADAIESRFLKTRGGAPGVQLIVDGEPIALNPIMRAMVGNTVLGMIAGLKGVTDPDRVDIRLWGQRGTDQPETDKRD